LLVDVNLYGMHEYMMTIRVYTSVNLAPGLTGGLYFELLKIAFLNFQKI
jgi:hypothetical protein